MSIIAQKNIRLKDGKYILLRTAEERDAVEINKLNISVMSEKVYAIHEPDEYKVTSNDEMKKIKRYRDEAGKLILTAFDGNNLAGYVSFNNWDTRKTMHTGFLTIYLDKDYRGVGLGEILMNELLCWGKKNKLIKKMSLAVFASNKNAIALYNKLGFKTEGVCPKDIKIKGKFVDSIFMYKFM